MSKHQFYPTCNCLCLYPHIPCRDYGKPWCIITKAKSEQTEKPNCFGAETDYCSCAGCGVYKECKTKEPKQEEYKEYEFCKAECSVFGFCPAEDTQCSIYHRDCVKTARQIIKWLKENNYKVIKQK